MKIEFICGCTVDKSLTELAASRDAEGFITCADHGMRRKGWRSKLGRDHAADGESDYDIEQYVVFNKPFPSPLVAVEQPKEDWRDNRDPLKMEHEVAVALREVEGSYHANTRLSGERSRVRFASMFQARSRLGLFEPVARETSYVADETKIA